MPPLDNLQERTHREIRSDGTTCYTSPDGSREYFRNGELHRDDGPAVELASGLKAGLKAWYRQGKLHRDDGPAIEDADGSAEWWEHGKLIANVPAQAFAIEDQARAENKQRDIERVIKTGTAAPIAVSRPLRRKIRPRAVR